MKYGWLGFFALLSLSSCGEPPTLAEEFPGDWQEPTPDVIVALAKKQIRGCGEFYQKVAASSSTEYMVACTRDRKIWVAYRVWPRIDEVLGPDHNAIWKLGGPPDPK